VASRALIRLQMAAVAELVHYILERPRIHHLFVPQMFHS